MHNIKTDDVDKLVLANEHMFIFFNAPWCEPGNSLKEKLDKISIRANAFEADVEAEPSIAHKYNVRGLPSMAYIHNGNVIAFRVGDTDVEKLEEWFDVCSQRVIDKSTFLPHPNLVQT